MGTTMMEKRGTCPACMGEFQLYSGDGKVVIGKHGWREIGGRQVGVYGLAEHVGECFGVGWAPFEISAEGTWAFLDRVVYRRCLGHLSYLARLATCPPLLDSDRGKEPVELTPTNDAGAEVVRLYRREGFFTSTRYEQAREGHVRQTEGLYRQDFSVGQNLTRLALAWAPAEFKDGTPPGPTVHFKKEGARLPYCGSRSYGLHTVADEATVTCLRCTKTIDDGHKAEAAKVALEADAATLTEYLRANGRKTRSEIKKGLGWDTKRTNRAVDRAGNPWKAIGTIRSVYDDKKPEAFEAR